MGALAAVLALRVAFPIAVAPWAERTSRILGAQIAAGDVWFAPIDDGVVTPRDVTVAATGAAGLSDRAPRAGGRRWAHRPSVVDPLEEPGGFAGFLRAFDAGSRAARGRRVGARSRRVADVAGFAAPRVDLSRARSTRGEPPTEETDMRFMIILKASKSSEAGEMPSQELIAAMGKYNEELVNAGVMVGGEGLLPSSQGARVRFSGDRRTVVGGPFSETEQLVAGFWLWQVKSREEAIEWVKRCPHPMPGSDAEIEIRRIAEAEDFGEEFTPELREQEERLRARAAELSAKRG